MEQNAKTLSDGFSTLDGGLTGVDLNINVRDQTVKTLNLNVVTIACRVDTMDGKIGGHINQSHLQSNENF